MGLFIATTVSSLVIVLKSPVHFPIPNYRSISLYPYSLLLWTARNVRFGKNRASCCYTLVVLSRLRLQAPPLTNLLFCPRLAAYWPPKPSTRSYLPSSHFDQEITQGSSCSYFDINPSGTGLFTSHIPNSLETVVKKHKRTASLFEKNTSVREK